MSTNLKIAKDTRRKQGLSALLEVLLKLQQANSLQRALKWVLAADRPRLVHHRLMRMQLAGGTGMSQLALLLARAATSCTLAGQQGSSLPACRPLVTGCRSLPHLPAWPCREAQESGEYAEAFWLCAQCTQSMEELGDGLRVAGEVRMGRGSAADFVGAALDSRHEAVSVERRSFWLSRSGCQSRSG